MEDQTAPRSQLPDGVSRTADGVRGGGFDTPLSVISNQSPTPDPKGWDRPGYRLVAGREAGLGPRKWVVPWGVG